MLSKDQIENNKKQFLDLISKINIPGADIEGLINFLTDSDFFNAPASTQYHCNYEGGLCEHSLHVYNELYRLANIYAPNKYEYNTILVVGLLHDLAKVNFYEKYIMNKKIYSDKGTKHDNQGNFDWFAEEAFKVKEPKDRFLGGEHGFNSMMLVGKFIPLTYEENLALLHHHCGLGESKQLFDLSSILNRYSLIPLIHMADFCSTFLLERVDD